MSPNTRLSIDRDFHSGACLNVLISTLVRLYRAMPPLVRVELCADRIAGYV
jgi:hypothetical protein